MLSFGANVDHGAVSFGKLGNAKARSSAVKFAPMKNFASFFRQLRVR